MKTLKNWPSKSEKCAPFLLVFFPELSTQLFQSDFWLRFECTTLKFKYHKLKLAYIIS